MALLPFVDEKRLRKALEDVYPDLTAGESEYIYIYVYIYVGSQEDLQFRGRSQLSMFSNSYKVH